MKPDFGTGVPYLSYPPCMVCINQAGSRICSVGFVLAFWERKVLLFVASDKVQVHHAIVVRKLLSENAQRMQLERSLLYA